MSKPPIVHVVDDDAAVRESLAELLRSVGMEALTYPSGDAFLAGLRDEGERPRAVLLDVRMPGTSGMAVLARLRAEWPDLPVVMITGHGDIEMAVRAMKLGAKDFITKPVAAQVLLDRLQEVLSQAVDQAAETLATEEAAARFAALTSRERDVFDRVVSGASNKAIAIDLGISVRTVETHRASLMEKLDAKTLVDLVLLSVTLKRRSP
jgi:two-component system response regulator FixJ